MLVPGLIALVMLLRVPAGHGGEAQAEAAKPLHALLITGGCCHNYTAQTKILTEGISARANVRWTIVHEGGDRRDHIVSLYKNNDWAKGYDVVVHNECFGAVTDVETVERIAKAHHNGVPAVMLHCSMHSYRDAKTDAWRECVGVTTRSHESRRPLEVRNIAPDHPIMKGFPQVWQTPTDEMYIVEKVWPSLTPLAEAYGVETKKNHVCIWTNTYGNMRIFATTLGHGNETMEQEVFLDVVTRGLLWVCSRLDE